MDPLLLRMRSRLEHLGESLPSERYEKLLRSIVQIDPSSKVFESTRFANRGATENIVVGSHSWIKGELITATSHASIGIGSYSFVGERTTILAAGSIRIGNFVLIAHMVDILDNNSHSLDYRVRRQEARDIFERDRPMSYEDVDSAPVKIEDDCWIGTKSTILKGVTIGRGAIVAANSVVVHDVPSFSLVGGNPARVLKQLPGEG